MLVKSSLSIEQLNRPVQAALPSVVAAASNTIVTSSTTLGATSLVQTQPITASQLDASQHQQYPTMKPDPAPQMMAKLAPNPMQTMDAGQLAFMEVGLDRTGKKARLKWIVVTI